MAYKQKQREDKKKLEDAKARAAQKGPMGMYSPLMIGVTSQQIYLYTCRWKWNKEKREKVTKLI